MLLIDTTKAELSVGGAIVLFGETEIRSEMDGVSLDDFPTAEIREIVRKFKENDYSQSIVFATLTPEEKTLCKKMMKNAAYRNHFSIELRNLKELASKRRIQERLLQITESWDLNDFSANKLLEIADDENRRFQDVNQNKWIDEYMANFNKPKVKILSFLPSLNRITNGGFNVPSLCTVGASPSTGKTAFAIQQMLKARDKNIKVVFFSLEMTESQIADRMMACDFGLDYSDIDGTKLSAQQEKECVNYLDTLKKVGNPIVVGDVYDVEKITAYIRKELPKFVIIDYLQIMKSTATHDSVRTLINYIMSELKRCAKDTGCTIMLLSQLKRSDTSKLPNLTDLKESGGIEEGSDYIVLLHRPYVFNKRADPHEMKAIVAKNKYGESGIINLYFDGKRQRITDFANEEDERGNSKRT